jgi:hypothetical protein
MQYYNPPCQCLNCHDPIHTNVFRQSVNYIGYALCITCQDSLKTKLRDTSRETIKLYFSLKKRGVPAAFEGLQTIDIAIVDTKVNIEVGEPQHSYHPDKALAALQQAFFSCRDGQLSLLIPSALVAYHLEETADYITEFLNASCRRGLQN